MEGEVSFSQLIVGGKAGVKVVVLGNGPESGVELIFSSAVGAGVEVAAGARLAITSTRLVPEQSLTQSDGCCPGLRRDIPEAVSLQKCFQVGEFRCVDALQRT